MPEPEDRKTAEDALVRLMESIKAIDEGIETANGSGTTVVKVTRAWVILLPADLPRMETQVTVPPRLEVAEIELRALAFWGAELRLESVIPKDGAYRALLYAEGGELKELSIDVLKVAARGDPEVAKVFILVQPGTGYEDRGKDLSRIYPQLTKRKEDLIERKLMTAEQIDRVGELGPLLLDPKVEPPEVKAARKLRNQAWTHFIRAYREIERNLDYIYYYDRDGRAKYPSIFARTAGSAEPVEPAATESTTTPAEATPDA